MKPRTQNLDVTIQVDEGTAYVEVEYTPGYPAYTSGLPEDCYPGERGSVEIVRVRIEDDEEGEMSADLCGLALLTFEAAHYDAIEEAAEVAAEERG